MATTAQLLGTRVDAPKLEDVHLLGAAVGAKGDWRTLNDSVSGDCVELLVQQRHGPEVPLRRGLCG